MGVKRGLDGPRCRSRDCVWVSNVAWPGHNGDLVPAYGVCLCGQTWPCRAIVHISRLLMGGVWRLLISVKRGPQWRSRDGGCLWSNTVWPGHSGDLVPAYGSCLWVSSMALPGHSADHEVAYGWSREVAYECQTGAIVEISRWRLLVGVKRGLSGP